MGFVPKQAQLLLPCSRHAVLREVAELADMTAQHFYMSNKDFNKLKKEHIEELEKREHWEALLENRDRVRLTGSLYLH